MPDDKKNSRTLIVVAIIGLVGSMGTALIANWNKLFPPQNHSIQSAPIDVTTEIRRPIKSSDTKLTIQPNFTIAEVRREAEKITAQWVKSWQTGDIGTLVELSHPPFFLDNEILMSVSDVKTQYQAGAQKKNAEQFTVDRIMSGTIAEYKRLGYVKVNDRLLSRIQLTDDDLVVFLIVSSDTLKEEGIGFYFRRLGNKVEMAGFWD